jgi:5'-deoxynucleotidase YfbR-like HD superfamily hydrolase
MISPFKAALGVDYRAFEDRLEHAIHMRFGLPARTPAEIKVLIKQADRISAYYEAVRLAGFTPAEAAKLFGKPPDDYLPHVEPLSASAAQERYLARFHLLAEATGLETGASAFDTE